MLSLRPVRQRVPLCCLLMSPWSGAAEEERGSRSEHPGGAAPIGPAAGRKDGGGSEEKDTGGRFQDDFASKID